MGQQLRAALYERVSVLASGRDARSVEEQNAAGIEVCAENNWAVTARYADPGRSASRFARKTREEYIRLAAAVKAREFDIVVLWEPSRGGRELETWAAFLNACRDTGTRIYVTSHSRLYDLSIARDWKTLAEDGVSSAYESEQTSQRVVRAMKSSAGKGRPHGITPYGYERRYDPVTGQLAEQRPCAETAPVVAEIITRVAALESLTAIGRDLEKRGIATPAGGTWNSALIRRIASNPAYIGHRSYNGVRSPAIWPPLVSLQAFYEAAAALDGVAARHGRPGAARHLLSHLTACGKCGSPLYVSHGSSQAQRPAYSCRRGCTGIRQDWLDGYVTGLVCARLDDPAFWAALGEGDGTAAALARARAGECRQQIRDARKVMIDGGMTAESFGAIETALLARIAAAEKEAEAAITPAALTGLHGSPGQARALFEARPVAVRKAIVRLLLADLAVLAAPRRGRTARFDPARVRYEFRIPGPVPVPDS